MVDPSATPPSGPRGEPLRLGVLGAAKISKKAIFNPVADLINVEVVAIASRDVARAHAQADEHGVAQVVANYEAVLDDDAVEAVYNPLPISLHHEWTIAALQAGKHVLCEKPLASNASEAQEIVDAAASAERHMVEAFHWRYHPLAARIRSLLDEGAIGEIRHIDARFDVPIPATDDVRQSWELSGGALMDLGCYPVQWARFVAGTEPTVTAATMTEGRPRVDVRTEVGLSFPASGDGDAISARLFTSMEDGVERVASLTVEGTEGVMQVDNPLAPHVANRLRVTPNGQASTVDEQVAGRSTYHHQLVAFHDLVRYGAPVPTGGDDSVATMKVIDAAYTAAGLTPRGVE